MSSPNAGDRAPSFRLPALDGRTYTLEEFAGRALVLVFLRHLA